MLYFYPSTEDQELTVKQRKAFSELQLLNNYNLWDI